MRKKCTNSSCRRTFSVKAETQVSCPFCGKVYPRILPAYPTPVTAIPRMSRDTTPVHTTGWSVILEDSGCSRLAVIKVIREYIRKDLGLRDMVDMTKNCPAIVISGQTHVEACVDKRLLENAGAKARVAKLTNREMQYFYTA